MENKPEKPVVLENSDKIPFVGLKKSEDIVGDSAVFYDLPGHPELVVRKCYVLEEIDEQIKAEISQAKEHKNCSPEELLRIENGKKVERLMRDADVYGKILEKYGLHFAKSNYVIGDDPDNHGKPALFAVTERIEGEDISKMFQLDEKITAELIEMYSGIFLHFKDSYLENGIYFGDFRSNQIMYGVRKGEKEPHLYFIDADPLVESWKEIEEQKGLKEKEERFWDEVLFIFEDMENVEKVSTSKKWNKAWNVAEQIIKEIPEPRGVYAKKNRKSLIKEINN